MASKVSHETWSPMVVLWHCDEIHGYCLNRLFDELVEEPSNILFTTKTGPDTIRYDAMNASFWIECLDLMEASFSSPKE